MKDLARQKRNVARCMDALALLHRAPVMSDEERARIEAELAKPRQGKQPELPLPIEEAPHVR